jgi:hypothetical protein
MTDTSSTSAVISPRTWTPPRRHGMATNVAETHGSPESRSRTARASRSSALASISTSLPVDAIRSTAKGRLNSGFIALAS